jgi:antitoxin PrlF
MELQARTLVKEKGRLIIPAAMREALGIEPGTAVELRVVDNELRISTMQSRLRRAQESVRKYIPEGVLLSEELSAERREAAKHE